MGRKLNHCPKCGGEITNVALDRYQCMKWDCTKLWLIHELTHTKKKGVN